MRWLIFLSVLITLHTKAQEKSSERALFKLNDDNVVRICPIFSKAEHTSIELDSTVTIQALAISGQIIQPTNDSFVRIILEDCKNREYIVLETCKLYNDQDSVQLSDYCEETKILLDVQPRRLRIHSFNASAIISQISEKISDYSSKNKQADKLEKMKNLSNSVRLEQTKFIANAINVENKKKNKLWRAEATELALLPWEERKKLLGIHADCFPYGFEYYATGIFEFGEVSQQTNSRTESLYVESFDWRNRHGKNWMTPVKNQGANMSCWAFAAVGVTEAVENLYFNQKIDSVLSEQEVLSCSGCGSLMGGGSEGLALKWIANHGVSEDSAFPFSNSDEPCSNKGDYNELIRLNGASIVRHHTLNNNDAIKKALIEHGPLTSGFTYNDGAVSGHAMVLVGYATIHEGDTIRYFEDYSQSPDNYTVIHEGDNRIGQTYWIFKNSYGTNSYHDHNGYAYILFNDQDCFRLPYYAITPVSSLLFSDSDIAVTDEDGDGYYYWGIGSKPSHCPNWVPDEPDGDDSDYEVGPMDTYGNLYDLSAHVNDTICLASNTTWTQKRFIYNNIIIPSGVTLHIKSEVVFYNGARITLRGGTVIIDGGHLFNADINVEIAQSDVIVNNGGVVETASDKNFEIPLGTTFQMDYGTIK